MSAIDLETARKILEGTLEHARQAQMQPLAVVVLDARGAVKLSAAEDGVSLKRADIAFGKAHGAIALGLGSRALGRRAQEQAYFITAATHAIGGALVPVPGGVLIKKDAAVIGAVGVSGDNSDNDEAAALAGIKAAGLVADPG